MPTQTLEPYPSDLTDAEWEILAPLIPGPARLGRPPRYEKRTILNAIFYLVRSGCSWRMLPSEMPPWRIVYYYFMRWREDGVWIDLHEALRDALRRRSGKKKPPGLRYSMRRVLELLTTPESVALMRERRCWAANDILWSTLLE
jgi:putative transposase